MDESRIEESLEFIKLLAKYSDGYNKDNTQEYFQRNIVHIDSVMQHCIELVKQEDYNNLYHPLYTVHIKGQKQNINAIHYQLYCWDAQQCSFSPFQKFQSASYSLLV